MRTHLILLWALLGPVTGVPQDKTTLKAVGTRAFEAASRDLGDYKARLEESLKDLKKHSPSTGWNVRGVQMVRAGDGPAAKYCFGRAVAEDPGNASAAANLGFTLLRLKELDEAEALLRPAAAIFPESPDVLNNFAWVLSARGKYDEALRLLDAAAPLTPGHPQIDYGRAWLLHRLHRKDAARRLLKSLTGRYPRHAEARELLDSLEKDDRQEELPFDPKEFPGQKEPESRDLAAFIADMLRRHGELLKESEAVLDQIAKSWTPEMERSAKAERAAMDERLKELWKKAGQGDKKAADEYQALNGPEAFMFKSFGGRCDICNLTGDVSPTERIVTGERERLHPEGTEIDELREKKSDFTREDGETALRAAAEGLSTRLRLLHLKTTYAQHAETCPAAIAGVKALSSGVRKAIRQLHEGLEKKLEELREQRDAHEISGEEYLRRTRQLTEETRLRCRKLQMDFRRDVASAGRQWKGAVDGRRADVLAKGEVALKEFEQITGRWFDLGGRRPPDEGELTMIRMLKATDPGGSSLGLRELQGTYAALGLSSHGSFAIQQTVRWAREMMSEFPPRLAFTMFDAPWGESGDFYEYATCVLVFSPSKHKLECPDCDLEKFDFKQLIELIGVGADVAEIDLGGVSVKMGIDGTVSVEVGEGVRGGVSVNAFDGTIGMKLGYGYKLGGLGAGAFVTFDNKEGLGWVAEVDIGKSTLTAAEGTLWEIPAAR